MSALSALIELGFTQMEAEVYVCLLETSPQTGYAIAKQLGKPAPYVYRAVDALVRKSAVFLDKGDSKLCRAVPYEELLEQLKRSFQQRCSEAETQLRKVPVSDWDDRIYHLTTVEQVYERAIAMINAAQDRINVDVFPLPLLVLRDALEKAHERGVKVAALLYEPVKLKVTKTVVFRNERLVQDWPSRQWILVTADANEYLVALLSEKCEKVYQAIYSGSPVLSYVQQYTMSSEFLLSLLIESMFDGADNAQMQKIYRQWLKSFWSTKPIGAHRMEKMFGWE
ncbi:MAG: TrmB family transcriptional regulator [bacterium]|nr:TrmB family transcriptional regulator [bacterium]